MEIYKRMLIRSAAYTQPMYQAITHARRKKKCIHTNVNINSHTMAKGTCNLNSVVSLRTRIGIEESSPCLRIFLYIMGIQVPDSLIPRGYTRTCWTPPRMRDLPETFMTVSTSESDWEFFVSVQSIWAIKPDGSIGTSSAATKQLSSCDSK